MKKILTSLATLGALATTANADFIRTEIGGGLWMQEPSGVISGTTAGSLGSTITYTDNSIKNNTDQNYIWAYIKHPLPIIPNLRLEYTALDNAGIATLSGQMSGFNVAILTLHQHN